MKKLILAIVALEFLFGSCMWAVDQPENAQAIFEKYQVVSIPGTMRARLKVMVVRSGQQPQEMVSEIFCQEKEGLLLRCIEPERQRGMVFLQTGSECWIILPHMKKPSKLSRRSVMNRMELTHIAYLVWLSNSAGFVTTLEGSQDIDGVNHYILELQDILRHSPFDRVKIWIRNIDYLAKKAEFFSRSGKMILSVTNDKFQKVKGIPYHLETTIVNPLREGEKTLVSFEEIEFNISLPMELFDKNNLARSAQN